MGREALCDATFSWHERGKRVSGKLLLETDEIVFRGDPRVVVKRANATAIAADGEALEVTSGRGVARFFLGDASASWAERFRSPPDRLKKLGIAAASKVAIVGDAPADFLVDLAASGATTVKPAAADVTLAFANDLAALRAHATLATSLLDGHAIWLVYPKGRKDIREADVLAAGRSWNLTDTKVTKFSESHTALRFIPSRAKR